MFRLTVFASACSALLCWSTAARSDIIFNFIPAASGDHDLGTSSATYTASGVTIVATGYAAPGVKNNLFGKNDGGDEKGLGLTGFPDNEIAGKGFIQLDLTGVPKGDNVLSLVIGSAQPGENYVIWGATGAGMTGTLTKLYDSNVSGLHDYPASTPLGGVLPSYLDVQATGPSGDENVLVSSLSLDPHAAPEPSSLVLCAIGAVGLAFGARRLRTGKRAQSGQTV